MASIEAIASAVLQPDVLPSHKATLAHGAAGAALFFAALSHARSDARAQHSETAMRLLERAVGTMASQALPAALYGGFTGVAWTVEHLQGRLFERDENEDPNTGVDEAVAAFVAQRPWRRDYDLIGGLTGIGVYALERLPSGTPILEAVVERLRETAVVKPRGVTWHTSPELLPEWQRKHSPDGYYNLGLAHGVPGVIALLGQAVAAGVAVETARPLLDGAVRWLLAEENAAGSASCFPTFVSDRAEGRRQHARLAWCYGDLGVSAALLWAARNVGEPSWEREAIRFGLQAARRTFEESGVTDAGLCHGAAGNGHLFNRLYQATREPAFLEAARSWFERTLAMRQEGAGVAGFPAWDPMHGGWRAEPGLLEGALGVGLALLAAVDSVPPDWDRMLLVSVPPVEARIESTAEPTEESTAGNAGAHAVH